MMELKIPDLHVRYTHGLSVSKLLLFSYHPQVGHRAVQVLDYSTLLVGAPILE